MATTTTMMEEPELELNEVFAADVSENSSHHHSWGYASVERRLDLNLSLNLEDQEGRMSRILKRRNVAAFVNGKKNNNTQSRVSSSLMKPSELTAVVNCLEDDLTVAMQDVQSRVQTYRKSREQNQQQRRQLCQLHRDTMLAPCKPTATEDNEEAGGKKKNKKKTAKDKAPVAEAGATLSRSASSESAGGKIKRKKSNACKQKQPEEAAKKSKEKKKPSGLTRSTSVKSGKKNVKVKKTKSEGANKASDKAAVFDGPSFNWNDSIVINEDTIDGPSFNWTKSEDSIVNEKRATIDGPSFNWTKSDDKIDENAIDAPSFNWTKSTSSINGDTTSGKPTIDGPSFNWQQKPSDSITDLTIDEGAIDGPSFNWRDGKVSWTQLAS